MPFNFIPQKVAKIGIWITIPVFIISILFIIVFPTIYNRNLSKQITLEEGTIVSTIWEDIPLPIYEKLYFFNITNKESFLDGSQPLNVTEVGPYTYKARWVKKDLHRFSNSTVCYKEVRTYHFMPDLSNGTEDDIIYTLNGPMILASKIAENYNVFARAFLSFIFSIEDEEVIIKRSIKELAYDGYEDIIIKYAPYLKPDIPYKDGKFSWLYGKNASDDGLFTVFTGSSDASKTNFINRWNRKELLSFWKGDTCNMMNGTSIETGPPIDGYQESYSFFQSLFCRSLTFNYTGDETYYDILAKRFRPTYSVFANSSENPDNYCFETGKERPSGILDISSCQFGAPVFISFPHFHMADPSYLHSVNGLNPIDNEHGSYLDVEPITGLSIGAIIRFQINVEVTKIKGVFQLNDVTKGIFPILWAELNLQIDEEWASFLKRKLNNPKIIAFSVLCVLAIISLILTIIFIIVLSASSKKDDDDDDPLIDAEQDNVSGTVKQDYEVNYNIQSCSENENSGTATGSANTG